MENAWNPILWRRKGRGDTQGLWTIPKPLPISVFRITDCRSLFQYLHTARIWFGDSVEVECGLFCFRIWRIPFGILCCEWDLGRLLQTEVRVTTLPVVRRFWVSLVVYTQYNLVAITRFLLFIHICTLYSIHRVGRDYHLPEDRRESAHENDSFAICFYNRFPKTDRVLFNSINAGIT